jgi:hypothetical protein
MHGHQWFPVEGTIVDAEPAHGRHEYRYTIQARKPDGALISRTIKHKDQVPYQVGTKVRAQFSDTNEIRFDPNYTGEASILATMDMTDQIRAASEQFNAGPVFDGGVRTNVVLRGNSQGAAAFAGLLGAAGATVSAVGPDGQPIQVDPAELSQLAQTMLSGDPAARQAAADRLRQLGHGAQQP